MEWIETGSHCVTKTTGGPVPPFSKCLLSENNKDNKKPDILYDFLFQLFVKREIIYQIKHYMKNIYVYYNPYFITKTCLFVFKVSRHEIFK